MSEPPACPICNGLLIPLFKKNDYHIGQCPSCDVMAVMEQITEAALTTFYNEQMVTSYRPRYRSASKQQRAKWQRRLRLIQAYRDDNGPGVILDVGCSYGAFLFIAQEAGWQTTGIEITQEGIDASRERLGHERVFQHLSALTEPGSFDAICMWDIIEHLNELMADLEKLHRLLKPNGLLALATVNTGAWSCKWFASRWRLFTPPAHLVYFNPHSMKQTLAQVGFEQIFSSTRFLPHVFWQSLTGNARGRSALPARVARRLLTLPIGIAAKWFDAGETLEVLAKRI